MFERLKCKILSLAAEAQIIRQQERKLLRTATEMRIRQRLTDAGYPPRARERILRRARGRSVRPQRAAYGGPAGSMVPMTGVAVPEASWIADHDSRYVALHYHRTVEVRREARAAHIAYNFLRGRDYVEVEQKSFERPPWHAVRSIVSRFCEQDPRIVLQRLAEWESAAGKWRHPDLRDQ